jgi:hypothetical protein
LPLHFIPVAVAHTTKTGRHKTIPSKKIFPITSRFKNMAVGP